MYAKIHSLLIHYSLLIICPRMSLNENPSVSFSLFSFLFSIQNEKVQEQAINLTFFQTHFKTVFAKNGWFGFDLTDKLPSSSVR